MNIVKLKDIKSESRAKGVNVVKVKSDFPTQTVNILLEPTSILPIHTTPVNVIFYVIEGRGIVQIGEEKIEVAAGSYIDRPADIPHGWENPFNEKLSVLVIKLYS